MSSSTLRRLLGLPPRIALGFAAALVSLLVAGAFSTFALAARGGDSDLVTHATETSLALEEVESALLVAHASLDAWLGTRDGHHRERHAFALSKIDPALEALDRLVDDEPEERTRLDRLVPAIRAVRVEHAEALGLADSGDLPGALALRRGRPGTLSLDQAKSIIDELELHEIRELEARQVALARTVAVSNTGMLLAQGVLLVLVGFAARLVRDEIRAREEHEAAREHALEVQQRLMAVVGHDLRNPLTGILAAGWALGRARLPEGEALLARRIVGAGRRMERLIRDLLDWSRVHGGAEIPVSPCEADLAIVCRRIVDELSEREPGRLRFEASGDTRAVFDPDRMEQVVANLVTNALRFAPPETAVSVRASGDGAELRLEVSDEGPGVSEEARARLFEPFRRGDAAGDGGLGLGLFIVRTLVAAQGGTVELASPPGQGARFLVRLPRGARPVRPPRVAAAGRPLGGAART